MSAFTGTARLVRLALRRDRIELPIWIIAIIGIVGLNLSLVIDVYASTPDERTTYAATSAPSIVARVTGGPLDGPDIGAIVMNEVFLFFALAVAFMSVLTVVRHTRQNEETGRAELIGSAIVGRSASLTAALVVAALANAVVATLVVLVLLANDLPFTGSLATGAAIGCIGIVFAALAAVTAQVAESARGANSLAIAGIGIAFVMRAIGDGVGGLTDDGLAVVSAWPSWLSPIGWAQQLHPFTQGNWWIFSLFVVLTIVLVGGAFMLTARRDLGFGLLPPRRGPAIAARSLLSPFGLAWRLQRGLIRGWAIAMAVLGAAYGLMAKEFETLLTTNEQLAEMLRQLGGSGGVTDVFFGAMMRITGLVIAGYALQALLRMQAEEAGGRLELVLATRVSRPVWMLSHLSCVLIGVTTLVAVLGMSVGLSYVLAADASWNELVVLTGSAFAQAPAVLALAGFVSAVFGLLPRWAVALSWGGFTASFVVGQLGTLLNLPRWIMNLSPFTHVAAAPAEAVTVMPVVALLATAIALSTLGVLLFRRRNYAF